MASLDMPKVTVTCRLSVGGHALNIMDVSERVRDGLNELTSTDDSQEDEIDDKLSKHSLSFSFIVHKLLGVTSTPNACNISIR